MKRMAKITTIIVNTRQRLPWQFKYPRGQINFQLKVLHRLGKIKHSMRLPILMLLPNSAIRWVEHCPKNKGALFCYLDDAKSADQLSQSGFEQGAFSAE